MRLTIGTALLVSMLMAGGAYAQEAKQPQDQMRAPGTGTNNPPGQQTQAPSNTGVSNMPTSSQPPVNEDQQRAAGTGTHQAPGGQEPETTGAAPGPKRATPPVPGTGTHDRGSAPGTGTNVAPRH
jgi:hypothetical protein